MTFVNKKSPAITVGPNETGSGSAESARRNHYRALVEAWGEADVSLPDVEEARRRLEVLGG